MPQKISITEFFEKFSLAQQIAAADQRFKDYSGSDTELAKKLADIDVLIEHEIIEETDDIKLMKDLIKQRINATFASSPITDVFTKLGFKMPKSRGGVDMSKEAKGGTRNKPAKETA